MKKSSLLAISILTPPLLASTANSSQHEPNQHECSSSHENVQSFPLNDLLPEIRALVLQHVPFSYLVCREWEEMTREHRALKLKVFLEKSVYFEALFDSDKVRYEMRYIGRHFNTPGEMYRMLSRIIASSYDKVIESAKVEGGIAIRPNVLESLINQRIESFLRKNRLINELPKLLLNSEDFKGLLFDLLSGDGNFSEIPLRVRRFVAKKTWSINTHHENTYPLSSILSSFHDQFDAFKDCLVEVGPDIVAIACVKIALGINCTMPSVNDQRSLLDSIKQLFSDNSLIQTTCSLCERLSPNSSMSEILEMMQEDPLVSSIAFEALKFSSEHMTVIWYIGALGESNLPFDGFTMRHHLLFNFAFLAKHQLLDDQLELLKKCDAHSLLWNLPPDLAGLNTQALVKWVNADDERKRSLSFDSLVILYSLDDDDAISKYSDLLLIFKESPKGLFYFSSIALGIGFGGHLNRSKKVALLQLMYPGQSDIVVMHLSGDRKELFSRVLSLLDNDSYTDFIQHITESDFLMLVETSLESSETCNVLPLRSRHSELALQALLRYIGDDIDKAATLQQLAEYYQIMVFLLADCDKVADYLLASGALKLSECNWLFQIVHSDWKALRAAKRIHEYQLRHPQQRQ